MFQHGPTDRRRPPYTYLARSDQSQLIVNECGLTRCTKKSVWAKKNGGIYWNYHMDGICTHMTCPHLDWNFRKEVIAGSTCLVVVSRCHGSPPTCLWAARINLMLGTLHWWLKMQHEGMEREIPMRSLERDAGGTEREVGGGVTTSKTKSYEFANDVLELSPIIGLI